ncbi:MAG: DUF2190 family protein [Candidatus Enterosoma sp.]|nr:DUF2190 family protein [Candidatus Enterosoma sp.]
MSSVKTDFLSQEINQFDQTDVRGRVDLMGMGNNVISAVINSEVEADVYSGDAVEILATSKGLPEVKPLTNLGKVFGFVRYNAKKVKLGAGDRVELAIDGTVMVMAASEAINAGEEIAYNYSTGLIAPASSGNVVVGIAIDAIAADSTGRVIIKAFDRKAIS